MSSHSLCILQNLYTTNLLLCSGKQVHLQKALESAVHGALEAEGCGGRRSWLTWWERPLRAEAACTGVTDTCMPSDWVTGLSGSYEPSEDGSENSQQAGGMPGLPKSEVSGGLAGFSARTTSHRQLWSRKALGRFPRAGDFG